MISLVAGRVRGGINNNRWMVFRRGEPAELYRGPVRERERRWKQPSTFARAVPWIGGTETLQRPGQSRALVESTGGGRHQASG